MLEVYSFKLDNTKIKWAKDTVRLLSLYALFYPVLGSPRLRFSSYGEGGGKTLLCPVGFTGWSAFRSLHRMPVDELLLFWTQEDMNCSLFQGCWVEERREEEESGIDWTYIFSIPGTGSGLSWTQFMQSLAIFHTLAICWIFVYAKLYTPSQDMNYDFQAGSKSS